MRQFCRHFIATDNFFSLNEHFLSFVSKKSNIIKNYLYWKSLNLSSCMYILHSHSQKFTHSCLITRKMFKKIIIIVSTGITILQTSLLSKKYNILDAIPSVTVSYYFFASDLFSFVYTIFLNKK